MRRFTLLLAIAVLAIGALALPVEADPPPRPFHGSATGGVTFVPAGGCPIGLETVSSATGTAAHMGRMTLSAAHCTPTGPDITGGEMVLTAANGDTVEIVYSGTAPFPVPGQPTTIVADTLFEIVDGTGRFAGASGGGEMTAYIVFPGDFDPANYPWQATWHWSGTIDY